MCVCVRENIELSESDAEKVMDICKQSEFQIRFLTICIFMKCDKCAIHWSAVTVSNLGHLIIVQMCN